jgi:hypothetical protein
MVRGMAGFVGPVPVIAFVLVGGVVPVVRIRVRDVVVASCRPA